MSIYSVALEHGKRLGREDGEKIGEQLGRKLGEKVGEKHGWEASKLETICKKLRRGKSLEVIADEMEVEMREIRPMYELARTFGPEYDSKIVMEAWFKEEANR